MRALFMAGAIGFLIIGSGPCLSQVPTSTGLRLSPAQLNTELGVGNAVPAGARTYAAWEGWQGPGVYNFAAANYVTPYLVKIQQLNNWNYVLFRTPRAATEGKGEIQAVSEAVQRAVDDIALDCIAPASPGIQNNVHGVIRLLSGTDAFEVVSSTNKIVTVAPGSRVDGTLSLRVVNGGPGFAVAPLIATPSWGDPKTSFWPISTSVAHGEHTFNTHVHLVAPNEIGTYYIVFAMQLELTAANVASGTNWEVRRDIWGDGNDVSQFSAEQVAQAQQYGCTVNRWLATKGYSPLLVPSDAIKLKVEMPHPRPRATKTISLGQTPEEVVAILGPPKNIVDLGAKKVYVYDGRKISFTGGKVSDVQ